MSDGMYILSLYIAKAVLDPTSSPGLVLTLGGRQGIEDESVWSLPNNRS